MKIPLTFLAIFCAVLFIAAGLANRDKVKIGAKSSPTQLDVTVTVFDITDSHRWIVLYGCSAEIYEHGTFCTGDFERRSDQEIRVDQAQYPFMWRSVPRGKILLTALVYDGAHKALARGQRVVIR